MILWSPHQLGGGSFNNGHPNAKDAFKVCPTPDPCLVVEGQRHMRFPGVPRTKSSILLTIRIHQIRWRVVTGLPITLDAFIAIPRRHKVNLWQHDGIFYSWRNISYDNAKTKLLLELLHALNVTGVLWELSYIRVRSWRNWFPATLS
jgi:hypothetical protein